MPCIHIITLLILIKVLQFIPQAIHEGFPFTIGIMQSFDHTISMTDCDKGEKGKNLLSNDDDPSSTGEGGEVHNDAAGKGKKESPWQRKK